MTSSPTRCRNRPGRPAGRRPEQVVDVAGAAGSEISPRLPGLLGRLGLAPEDVAALARQGFVAADRRVGGRRYFRLCWRAAGQQRTRYLGDAERASQARRELALLQRERTAERELARLRRDARRLLRASKAELAARLKDRGLHFHGLAIRRRDARP